jgi:hypothetical protein
MATSLGERGEQSVLDADLNGLPHFGANITSSFKFGSFLRISTHQTNGNRISTQIGG